MLRDDPNKKAATHILNLDNMSDEVKKDHANTKKIVKAITHFYSTKVNPPYSCEELEVLCRFRTKDQGRKKVFRFVIDHNRHLRSCFKENIVKFLLNDSVIGEALKKHLETEVGEEGLALFITNSTKDLWSAKGKAKDLIGKPKKPAEVSIPVTVAETAVQPVKATPSIQPTVAPVIPVIVEAITEEGERELKKRQIPSDSGNPATAKERKTVASSPNSNEEPAAQSRNPSNTGSNAQVLQLIGVFNSLKSLHSQPSDTFNLQYVLQNLKK